MCLRMSSVHDSKYFIFLIVFFSVNFFRFAVLENFSGTLHMPTGYILEAFSQCSRSCCENVHILNIIIYIYKNFSHRVVLSVTLFPYYIYFLLKNIYFSVTFEKLE
jgi:hypothetical protein